MRLDEIDLLEKGLEDQAAAIERAENEPATGTRPSPAPGVPGQPLSAADERMMEIAKYEAQQAEQAQEMTSAERLASMGITVTSASEADEA